MLKIAKKVFHFFYCEFRKIKNFPKYGYLRIFFLKIIGYLSFIKYFFLPTKSIDTSIDVIITIAPKDVDKLENCLIGIKKNILHPISQIFVIGKSSLELSNIEKKYSCVHVEEENLLSKNKLNINYTYNDIDRSGWLYQQMLNYEAVLSLGNENLKLAVDSDTVFSKKQIFIKGKKIIFNASDSYHRPYFEAAKKLLDLPKVTNISFTSHHIIYNRKFLMSMLNYIKNKYNEKEWYNAILKNIDYQCFSNHSEFETYAQYVMYEFRNSVKVEYWFNKDVRKKDLLNIKDIFNSFFHKSLSFHDWLKNE